jgi:adenylyltransferase/sulfurtransferase
MTAAEVRQKLKQGDQIILLDVRSYAERDVHHIGGFHIPIEELPSRVARLDPDSRLVVYCSGDARSSQALRFLREKGFLKAVRLLGGLAAYSAIEQQRGD